MRLADLLLSDCAALPKESANGDFGDYLEKLYDNYLSEIDRLLDDGSASTDVMNRRGEIPALGAGIVASFRAYLRGQPEQAYKILEAAMLGSQSMDSLFSIEVRPEDVGPLYRMVEVTAGSLKRERGFHPPFELRHVVSQHRYGIPGFPCLYLCQ